MQPCFAASAFIVIGNIQVYGGGVSIILGSYVWSTSSFGGLSACISGVTNVSDISIVLDNCSFVNCSAVTSSIQGEQARSSTVF
jgi:hypothetical protein